MPGEAVDILLVEDSVDDAALTLRALAKLDPAPKTVVATDGLKAMQLLFPTDESPAVRPKLVLLDLKLPKHNGFEVLGAIRSNKATANLPVVVVTASGEDRDQDNASEFEATEYLVKPSNYHHYLGEIVGVVSRYL